MKIARRASLGVLFAFAVQTIALGAVGDPPTPTPVEAFIAMCRTPERFETCRLVVVAVGIGGGMVNHDGYCPIGIKDMELATHRVVDWLAQHNETYGDPPRDAVRKAIGALWPC
jgi:hypothetical protein